MKEKNQLRKLDSSWSPQKLGRGDGHPLGEEDRRIAPEPCESSGLQRDEYLMSVSAWAGKSLSMNSLRYFEVTSPPLSKQSLEDRLNSWNQNCS